MNSLAKELLSYIDLTSLNATDNVHSINELVDFALEYEKQSLKVAAICVFPNFGAHVKNRLQDSAIHTAVVAGLFPHGQSFLEVKAQEVRIVSEIGVDDIDVVLNRGLFFNGDLDGVHNEIVVLKDNAGNSHLKVILETGELRSDEYIRKAAQIAITAGADFIKTSTGKCEVGATETAVRIMCHEIKREFENSGRKVGLKPSGGIRTFDEAALYRDIVLAELGESWLTPTLFRIGASSLTKDLINIIRS